VVWCAGIFAGSGFSGIFESVAWSKIIDAILFKRFNYFLKKAAFFEFAEANWKHKNKGM
jgi:hypothetical protein